MATSTQPSPVVLSNDQEHKRPTVIYTRFVKVDFPRFEGTDVQHWIFKAEQYFNYYGVDEVEIIQLEIIHFVGQVVPWYQMLQKSGILTSWLALVKALEHDYGPSLYENLDYALFNLFKEDTVANYYAKFMELANPVDNMTHATFLSRFISGLTKYLQRKIIPWKP